GVYSFNDVAVGDRTITAAATGYITNTKTVTVTDGGVADGRIELTPGVTPTPTPPCEPVELDAEPEPLKLLREESATETVTVTC
ncbi:hypothetical protein MST27_22190, partial [Pseudomonas sp. PS1]